MVGWLISRTSVRSHAHTASQPWAATCDKTRNRVGSDSALSFFALRSASETPSGEASNAQHSVAAPRRSSLISTEVLITSSYIDAHRCVHLVCSIDIHQYKELSADEHHCNNGCAERGAGHEGDVLPGPV